MKVVWLRTALRNLDDVAAYIASDDPSAALRVVERLRQATARLASHQEVADWAVSPAPAS